MEGNPEKTLQHSLDWLDQAAALDVKLTVFPELCCPGYNPLPAAKSQPDKYDEPVAVLKSLAEPSSDGAARDRADMFSFKIASTPTIDPLIVAICSFGPTSPI